MVLKAAAVIMTMPAWPNNDVEVIGVAAADRQSHMPGAHIRVLMLQDSNVSKLAV